mmetsp:Transcript_7347/g.10716  ORF Transcript_7347/g.10716 Transcript_7347/m.10716 type:complete len:379 (+) Transcript_7347:330-1466(+)
MERNRSQSSKMRRAHETIRFGRIYFWRLMCQSVRFLLTSVNSSKRKYVEPPLLLATLRHFQFSEFLQYSLFHRNFVLLIIIQSRWILRLQILNLFQRLIQFLRPLYGITCCCRNPLLFFPLFPFLFLPLRQFHLFLGESLPFFPQCTLGFSLVVRCHPHGQLLASGRHLGDRTLKQLSSTHSIPLTLLSHLIRKTHATTRFSRSWRNISTRRRNVRRWRRDHSPATPIRNSRCLTLTPFRRWRLRAIGIHLRTRRYEFCSQQQTRTKLGIVPRNNRLISDLQPVVLVQSHPIVNVHPRRGRTDHEITRTGGPAVSNSTRRLIPCRSEICPRHGIELRNGLEFILIIKVHSTGKISKSSQSDETSMVGPYDCIPMCVTE